VKKTDREIAREIFRQDKQWIRLKKELSRFASWKCFSKLIGQGKTTKGNRPRAAPEPEDY
jgi:hypothetical protein